MEAVHITIVSDVAAIACKGSAGNRVRKIGTINTPPPMPKIAETILVKMPQMSKIQIVLIAIFCSCSESWLIVA